MNMDVKVDYWEFNLQMNWKWDGMTSEHENLRDASCLVDYIRYNWHAIEQQFCIICNHLSSG